MIQHGGAPELTHTTSILFELSLQRILIYLHASQCLLDKIFVIRNHIEFARVSPNWECMKEPF